MKKLGRRKSAALLAKGESILTSVIIVVPNLGDCGNLELNSLEEFNQETEAYNRSIQTAKYRTNSRIIF